MMGNMLAGPCGPRNFEAEHFECTRGFPISLRFVAVTPVAVVFQAITAPQVLRQGSLTGDFAIWILVCKGFSPESGAEVVLTPTPLL